MFLDKSRVATHLLAITIAATIVGAASGVSSWALFEALDQATELRLDHGWLVWLLPVAAFILGAAYHYVGGPANRGTSLVVEQSLPPVDPSAPEHAPKIPYRMAPMIFGATYIAQLTGASVGREGAALQISGSITSQTISTQAI